MEYMVTSGKNVTFRVRKLIVRWKIFLKMKLERRRIDDFETRIMEYRECCRRCWVDDECVIHTIGNLKGCVGMIYKNLSSVSIEYFLSFLFSFFFFSDEHEYSRTPVQQILSFGTSASFFTYADISSPSV